MNTLQIRMMKQKILCLLALLVLAGCSGPDESEPAATPAAEPETQSLLQRGIEAMGGLDALDGDALINVTTQGVSFEPHQGGSELDALEDIANRYTSGLTSTLSGEKVHVDYRYSFEYPFPYKGSATMIINGKEGSVHGIDGFQSRYFGLTLPRPMYSRRLEALSKTYLMGNPYSLMNRIIEQNGINAQPDNGSYPISLHEDIPPIRVELDPDSGLPWRASAIERDYLFGDVEYQVTYEDWQAVDNGGIYPRRIDHSLDGFTLRAENITEVSFGDHKIDELTFRITSKRSTYLSIENPYIVVEGYDAEEGRRGLEASQWSMRLLAFGFSQDLPVDAVVIGKTNTSRNRKVNVAGNLYMAEGDTELMAYTSIIADTAEGIYVIEPVLHHYRSEAVIEAIREQFPGKPILGIIATHHHMDHLGGLRTYAAETGKVYIGAAGADFVRKSLDKKNTVFPDVLDSSDKEVEVIAVSENLTIGSGDDAFELIPYPTTHTEDLLVIYFPATKSLAIGDIFNGEMSDGLRFYNPETKNILVGRAEKLKAFIADRGMEVDTILTVHGGAVNASEIDAYLTGM
jgi:glyoxylase-like metal-dependent hydrolase (beta-lactamase superfamily II)